MGRRLFAPGCKHGGSSADTFHSFAHCNPLAALYVASETTCPAKIPPSAFIQWKNIIYHTQLPLLNFSSYYNVIIGFIHIPSCKIRWL